MKKARVCKYPGCAYYDKNATRYCCDACRHDHYDYEHMKKSSSSICHTKTTKIKVRARKYPVKKTRVCKYPDCYYYHKDATHYCCAACSGDHYDYERLKMESRGV